MKARCNREGLLTAFQIAAGVVPARSPKPILQNIHLNVTDETSAVLTATDLELGVRYQVSGVTAEEPGKAVIPASELSAILRELPDEVVLLEATGSGVRIVGGSSRFELPSDDPAQFPDLPAADSDASAKVKSGLLSELIRRTVFAAATENSRYALNSVLIEFDGDALRLVATDGKRLALMPGKATAAGSFTTQGLTLVPPKALSLLQKVLHDPEEEIEILPRENEIFFRTRKVTIYSRLVEGRFPRYQDVFPGAGKFKVPLIVDKLHRVVRQSRIVTSEESKGVEFHFSSGELLLKSRAADVGAAEVKLPIGYEGESFVVTYDPQYLIDVLRVLDPQEEVLLELVDTRRASVLRTKDDYAYVIMPLTKE